MSNMIVSQADEKTDTTSTASTFLTQTSNNFDTNSADMLTALSDAETALEKDPSNPAILAKYQARLQEYTLFRNAQSTTIKVYKDIGAAIIQNFR